METKGWVISPYSQKNIELIFHSKSGEDSLYAIPLFRVLSISLNFNI